MASANLDLVRSIYAGWERGDFSSAEWAHRDVECMFVGGPDPGSWTGLTGMAEGMRSWISAWEEFRVEPKEYRELDEDRVLVLVQLSGHGKTSGLEIGRTRAGQANLFHVRRGKVSRVVIYLDYERALADLGLAPDAGAADSD
jgi:ketosteroid isomerase-like protein